MAAAEITIHPEEVRSLGRFNGFAIREDVAYSNHRGQEKGGIRKRAQKALRQLKSALDKLLSPGETVFYVARAQVLPSKLEEFFLGWVAHSTHRGVLVFSNKRLLYAITDRSGRWRRSARSACWGDIEAARVRGWLSRTLRLQYRNGRTETFWKLRREDARKISLLVSRFLEVGSADFSPEQGMVHLCPSCVHPLAPGVYKCSSCGLGFKNERTMVRRSLIFPGLGYLYAGHAGLAFLDLFIEAILLLEVVVCTLAGLGLFTPRRPPGQPPPTPFEAWLTVGIFLGLLGFKKWLTIRHCRRFIREFIPVR